MTIRKYSYILIAAAVFLISGCDPGRVDREFSDQMTAYIGLMDEEMPVINGQRIYNPEIIKQIYTTDGDLVGAKWSSWANIDQLLNSIRNARYHGLDPEDYHLAAIYGCIDRLLSTPIIDNADSAGFDLILTDSFLMLGAHLARGKIDPATGEPGWDARDVVIYTGWKNFLETSLAQLKVAQNLEQLAPGHQNYIGLKEILAKYRQIEKDGGWPLFIPELQVIDTGMRHQDVAMLRKRLFNGPTGFDNDTAFIYQFGDHLYQEVVRFQERNGLVADGVVDSSTVASMNVSVYGRISQIKVNLDRWRRLHNPGDNYLAVNIPDYKLTLVKEGRTILTDPVIVGTPDRPTPVLSSSLTSLELNPYWFVPPGMIYRNIIPSARRDSAYFQMRNMEILDEDWRRVDPGAVDWNSGFAEGFPYIVRQKPGPDNTMGRVKFLFANKHYVTIHGTPSNHLFQLNDRALSNGCIRVRAPVQLAHYLLDGQEGLTMIELLKIIEQEKFVRIDVENQVPVHLFYFTAWAEGNETAHFRKDIYNLDQPLIEALQKPPPRDLPITVEMPTGMAATGDPE